MYVYGVIRRISNWDRARLVELPLHAADTTITVAGAHVEEVLREIEGALITAWASIDDLGLVLLAVLAGDGDVLATEWVVVGVAIVVRIEDLFGNCNNVLLLGAGETAGAEADGVVGQVAHILSARGGHAGEAVAAR